MAVGITGPTMRVVCSTHRERATVARMILTAVHAISSQLRLCKHLGQARPASWPRKGCKTSSSSSSLFWSSLLPLFLYLHTQLANCMHAYIHCHNSSYIVNSPSLALRGLPARPELELLRISLNSRIMHTLFSHLSHSSQPAGQTLHSGSDTRSPEYHRKRCPE